VVTSGGGTEFTPGAVIWMLTWRFCFGDQPAPAWPAIAFVLGALAGLLAMKRLCHIRSRVAAWLTALAGFATDDEHDSQRAASLILPFLPRFPAQPRRTSH
jgi:hypothetical protein